MLSRCKYTYDYFIIGNFLMIKIINIKFLYNLYCYYFVECVE